MASPITQRYMIALDTETGGLDPSRNPLLEVAFRIFSTADTTNPLATFKSFVAVSRPEWRACDEIALKVNGITWENTQTGKPLSKIAEEITALFRKLNISGRNAVYFCQNPTFDKGFFTQLFPLKIQEENRWPYLWFDLASMHFFNARLHNQPVTYFSKDAIAKQYGLPPEAKPHKALNGVDHLMQIYNHMVNPKLT